MPKFTKDIDELDTHFDKWMYVLKNLKRLENIPDKLREKIFEKIFEAAEIAKLSREEYEQYIISLNAYRDFKNSIDTARDEGRAEEKKETAIRLLKKGMSIADVSDATELSKEQIEELWQEIKM